MRLVAHIYLIIVLLLLLATPLTEAQRTAGREISFPVALQWPRQRAVFRYRLQIAADERFENVYLDRKVPGNSFTVKELSSGNYYWRVAPADGRVGPYSRPVKFFVSGGVVTPVSVSNYSTAAGSNRRY